MVISTIVLLAGGFVGNAVDRNIGAFDGMAVGMAEGVASVKFTVVLLTEGIIGPIVGRYVGEIVPMIVAGDSDGPSETLITGLFVDAFDGSNVG